MDCCIESCVPISHFFMKRSSVLTVEVRDWRVSCSAKLRFWNWISFQMWLLIFLYGIMGLRM